MIPVRLGRYRDRIRCGDTLTVFPKIGEVLGGVGVAAVKRTRERVLGPVQLIMLSQEHGEFKCTVGIASLIGARVRRRSTRDVTPFLEQHAEVDRGVGVAAQIGTRERVFCLGQPVLLR